MQATGSSTIEITMKLDGKATVQTKGFTVATCREASRFIEQALGKRENEQLTAEFHLSASQQTENQQ